MLYTKLKKDAIEIHEKAVKKYDATYNEMQKRCELLYNQRKTSIELILNIESLINSIANTPKEYEKITEKIRAEREQFRKTETYAKEAYDAAVASGVSITSGVAGGVAFASMAPTMAMWVATTFGTASTGTAISTLSGAAATKAALAWLGGGALSAGGAGVAGGQALLALAGPIGWGIAGTATVISVASLGQKNKKISQDAIEEAKKITLAGAELHESTAKVNTLLEETIILYRSLKVLYEDLMVFRGNDYQRLNLDIRKKFGTLVNNTLSLSKMLNKTI